jgi:hypothetical protein
MASSSWKKCSRCGAWLNADGDCGANPAAHRYLDPRGDRHPLSPTYALRAALGAAPNESIDEAASRVVLAYLQRHELWSELLSIVPDPVVAAALVVVRPGPSWNVREALAIYAAGGASLENDNGGK